ncbi:hypothetical protein TruAng_007204 [Truncatella angustata]|nr:hypothetical protein TruAng_007204 [Truncatella angustata]
MPTASNLKLGYFIACLTLVRQQLEAIGENLQSRTFMGDSILGDTRPSTTHPDGAVDTTEDLKRDLRKSCSELAENILRLFLELRPISRRSMTTDIHLCVAYCVLIVAHYDESQSGLSDEHRLDLVLRIDDYYRKFREFSRITKFPKLAQRRLQIRMKKGHNTNHEDITENSQLNFTKPTAPIQEPVGIENELAADCPISPGDLVSPFEIPSMQDFFGGAFLDFLQPSFGEQF